MSSPSTAIVPSQVPTCANRWASRIVLAALPHHVRQLLDDVERALPGEVEGDPLGLLHHHPQRAQRLDDLDPVAADALLHPVRSARVGGVAEVDSGLLVTAPQQHERILGAEVRVEAEPGDHEQVAGAVVGIEVAAVVEVAVAAAGPRDGPGQLVDRVLVERAEADVLAVQSVSVDPAHQAPTSARRRSNSGRWCMTDSGSSGRSISPKWTCRALVRRKTMPQMTPEWIWCQVRSPTSTPLSSR